VSILLLQMMVNDDSYLIKIIMKESKIDRCCYSFIYNHKCDSLLIHNTACYVHKQGLQGRYEQSDMAVVCRSRGNPRKRKLQQWLLNRLLHSVCYSGGSYSTYKSVVLSCRFYLTLVFISQVSARLKNNNKESIQFRTVPTPVDPSSH